MIMAFSLNLSYSFDTAVTEEIDTTKVETVISDTTSEVEISEEEAAAIANAERNAQYFMYGFLAMGAFLVFWKFKKQ